MNYYECLLFLSLSYFCCSVYSPRQVGLFPGSREVGSLGRDKKYSFPQLNHINLESAVIIN